MWSRIPIGELLLEANVISREELDRVLAMQKADNRRLGTLLVESGLVTETQVTQILSQQLSVPWVSLYHVDFSRQLLNFVPRELAEQYCLVPIFVRRVRGAGEVLYVAMDDPSNEHARNLVSQFSGLPVRAMIAPPSDIRSAIRVYYGAQSVAPRERSSAKLEVAEVLSPEPPQVEVSDTSLDDEVEALAAFEAEAPPTERVPSTPPEKAAPLETPQAPAAPPQDALPETPRYPMIPPSDAVPESAPSPDSGVPIPPREANMPKPRKGVRPRMITLTLLDGTQVTLPARQTKKPADPPPAEQALTARDLVAALRAMAHGTDARAVLGDEPRWEAMFAALLSVLLKKHLIADWEFVEEYKEK
jgi:type IV pilus assembly protein PilB